MEVHRYSIYCNVEEARFDTPEGEWYETPPTTCPHCGTTNINTSETIIIDTIADNDVNIASCNSDIELPTQVHGFRDLTGFNVFRKGYKFVVAAGETYEHEVSYTDDMMLQGLGYKLDGDVHEDDYLEVEIVDVDGVAYPPGTILAKFAETMYVIPNEVFEVVCEDAKMIYNWMYIRTRYVSNGTQNPVAVRLLHILRTIS